MQKSSLSREKRGVSRMLRKTKNSQHCQLFGPTSWVWSGLNFEMGVLLWYCQDEKDQSGCRLGSVLFDLFCLNVASR